MLELSVDVHFVIKASSRTKLAFAQSVLENEIPDTLIDNMICREDYPPDLAGIKVEISFSTSPVRRAAS